MSTDTFTRETPSRNKGIETPKPVTKVAMKRKNNSWFILELNGLAVKLLEADVIRMGLLALDHSRVARGQPASDRESSESNQNPEHKAHLLSPLITFYRIER